MWRLFCAKCREPRTTLILNELGRYEPQWTESLVTELIPAGGVEIKCQCGGKLVSVSHLDALFNQADKYLS